MALVCPSGSAHAYNPELMLDKRFAWDSWPHLYNTRQDCLVKSKAMSDALD